MSISGSHMFFILQSTDQNKFEEAVLQCVFVYQRKTLTGSQGTVTKFMLKSEKYCFYAMTVHYAFETHQATIQSIFHP